jgi:CDGSH-type Zn-finger protein
MNFRRHGCQKVECIMSEDTVVTVQDNGPYRIKGPVKIVTPTGEPFVFEGEQVWLCRCGHSENKPFCDGSHKRVGFSSMPRPKPD